jgi:type I restriction enzyme S subunit
MSLTIPVPEIISDSDDPLLAVHSSWERVSVSDIANILNGFAFESTRFSESSGIPLMRIRDVGSDKTKCNYDGPYEDQYVIKKGDLLIGMDGDFKSSRWNGPRALLNQRVCKLALKTNLYNPKLLELALPGYLNAINDNTSSQTVRHLSSRSIAEIPLPLPPLDEQHRILSALERLVDRVDKSRHRLAKVPKILKAFRQSVLGAACSGRLTEDWREGNPAGESAEKLLARIDQERAKSTRPTRRESTDDEMLTDLPELPELWRWTPMGRVVDVQGGIQKQPKRAPKKHAYPYLRVANVLRNRLDLSEIQQMELFDGELETYRLRRNDLLVVEGNGSLTEIGRSALWTGEIRDCVHQNHIIRVRARVCLPEYLNFYWNSPIGVGRVKDVAVTTAGLYSLSTKKVAALPAPIAPLEEQHEIVLRVEALFKLADAIEKWVAAATKRADKLMQSILAKAFRGELVPTEAELARREGRTYEPASELLARIRADRANTTTTTKPAAPANGIKRRSARGPYVRL